MAVISFSLSDNEKRIIEDLAKVKGFKNGAAMARVALFEYFRRKTQKEVVTVASVGANDN